MLSPVTPTAPRKPTLPDPSTICPPVINTSNMLCLKLPGHGVHPAVAGVARLAAGDQILGLQSGKIIDPIAGELQEGGRQPAGGGEEVPAAHPQVICSGVCQFLDAAFDPSLLLRLGI